MKKTIAAAIAAITFAGTANAATLSLSTRVGENLVTYAKSDDENDENDGFFFLDQYLDNRLGAQYASRGTYDFLTFSGETSLGGAEAKIKVMNKALEMRLYNAWVNFGNLRITGGAFDAYPVVDIIGDANVGHHYNSYAAQYMPGFDPQVMSWFLRNEGFFRSNHGGRIATTALPTGSTAGTAKLVSTLEDYNWYFYDPNNAGTTIDLDAKYSGHEGAGIMATYQAGDLVNLRVVSTMGAAYQQYGALTNYTYFGEKTPTNLTFQGSYLLPDIAKFALTVKFEDRISGVWNDGEGLMKSAGSDIAASFAASSDAIEDLKLYAGYMFGAAYLGMESDTGDSETFMFHSADLRAVYQLTDTIALGLDGNLSAVIQSDYAKSIYDDKGAQLYGENIIGFNAGLSATYKFSSSLSFDFNAGFRCLDVNHTNSTTGESDMLAVSSVGFEPSAVFTLTRNCSLSLGVNLLYQNLSGNDEAKETVWLNNNKNSGTANVVYPGTLVVTMPLYMKVSL